MKAYIILADGFEEMEFTFPVTILRVADVDVKTISINQTNNVIGAHGVHIVTDCLWNSCDMLNADALIIPGGQPGTDNLLQFKPLEDVIKFYVQNKVIAAICAAPIILGKLDVLNGRNAICFPGYENQLKGANIVNKSVVIDGNIITGQSSGVSKSFAIAIVKKLVSCETYQKIINIYGNDTI